MGKIYIVGIGPGEEEQMTEKAIKSLKAVDVIIGYTGYISLLSADFDDKEKITTGMRHEVDRCKICFEKALEGKEVALICSGDAGVYGMASLVYEMAKEYPEFDIKNIEVIAGVTASLSGAAVIGAPINHDFCTISLSDLLTPWEVIEKRLKAAGTGDFAIALYNPSSHKRADYLMRACDILLEIISEDTACGYVRNIGRDNTVTWTGSLKELRDEKVDMFTTCYIGNSKSYLYNGKLITPRGYKIQ